MANALDNPMHGVLSVARLTWLEARRTRMAFAALVCALLFLTAFGLAVYFLFSTSLAPTHPLLTRQMQVAFVTIAGLYVANFLVIAVSVMLPVDSISGEIESGVIETIASKPLARSAIILGKWLAYLTMAAVYLLLVAGGVVILVKALTGFIPPHLTRALPLMFLGAASLLTLSIAGGTRFNTVTNGIVVFGFYALAFIGGWVEEIGFFLGNQAARYIGTAISLLSPSDSMWRLASHHLKPPLMQQLPMGPFAMAAVPSGAMVAWTVGFVLIALALALRQFQKRGL